MRIALVLFQLSGAVLLWRCSGKADQHHEASDSVSYSDTIQNNAINTNTENTGQGNETIIIVGSDEAVNESSLDTAYYAIVRYDPVPGDFASLRFITNQVADLDPGESGERSVVHLVTSELVEKVETGIMFGTMSYKTEYLEHNYLYVIELKDGRTNVLSDYSLGDTKYIHIDIGANEEGNPFTFEPLKVSDSSFVITTVHQDELESESASTASVFLLKNNQVISVLDFPFQSMPFPSSYKWDKRETISNEFFDITLTEQGPSYQPSTREITTCRWNGKDYVCDPPKE